MKGKYEQRIGQMFALMDSIYEQGKDATYLEFRS
jgi:hypothetical protein